MSAREELACKIRWASKQSTTAEQAVKAADSIIAAGYHKPAIIGYVVVDRAGAMVSGQTDNLKAAQEFADKWNADAKAANIGWDYRVATITEVQA